MSSPISEISKGDDTYDEKFGTQSFHSDAVKYDDGVDVAVNLVAGAHADDAALSPEDFKRIRAKLDWNILPYIFLIYIRMSISTTSVLDVCSNFLFVQFNLWTSQLSPLYS
jgi:ACS family allantoate permease-like MFS transporter